MIVDSPFSKPPNMPPRVFLLHTVVAFAVSIMIGNVDDVYAWTWNWTSDFWCKRSNTRPKGSST